MKTLFLGIVVILLLGLGGFFYRNVAERTPVPEQIACTADAKLCPDGTGVGRIAPNCQFAPCPFPNAELPEAGISFVVPNGYTPAEDASLLATYVKPSQTESVPHRITVSRFPIGEGETADDVILAHTRYQPADMQAEDFDRFETVLIDGRQYRMTVIERFEAIVHSAYFLVRENDVLMFELVEHDVTEWMNPDLVVGELPEHEALISLLGTLQTSP